MTSPARCIIGVDVGGTFTDVFVLDEENGECRVAKVPSTRPDQSKGFIDGIRAGVDSFEQISTVVHGTTVGTNALLERMGARAGIITTRGFRDTLEMRRRDRPRTWGLWGQFDPVVPRDLRLEVGERTLADGTIHEAVDPAEIQAAARALIDAGVEALAIVFINAYANPANEQAALHAARQVWPNDYVNVSSDILPEIREFERTSTTTLNAYLQPPLGQYLERLESALQGGGFTGDVLIVQSNGGVMTVDTARRLPVRTALSGPAAGVIASAHIATSAGFPNVITCDMGGTSFDVSLVAGGESALAAQTAVDFGMVIRTPMIEITTIGAGGGSIAWVDRGGLLQIGPRSAGSDPGPVCYGQGNLEPTVTDANLVLGRINADRPIGGKLERLDVAAAGHAITQHVAEPLGLDLLPAAEAVIRVANSKMAGAIRLVSIERGHNPKDFAAMPFGGGGALHAGALIKDVGLKSALVPRYPGITSALGCTIADMRHDYVQTVNGVLGALDLDHLTGRMSSLSADGIEILKRAEMAFDRIDTVFGFDMSYMGQTHTVDVNLPEAPMDIELSLSEKLIRESFEKRYRETYGKPLQAIDIRILNLKVSVIGRRPKLDLSVLAPGTDVCIENCLTGTRQVWIDDAWHETGVYERLSLPVGARVDGPALFEQPDTTIFLEPDLYGSVDQFGNLIISRKSEPES